VRPGGGEGGDVAAMLERAAEALSELADGTDNAIAELRAELGRRQLAPSGESDEERELLEAVLERIEAARTETLGQVAILRRARAGLADAPQRNSRLDIGAVAPPRPRTAETATGRPAVAAAPVPQVPAGPEFQPDVPPGPDTEETAVGADAGRDEPETSGRDAATEGAGEGALLLATQMAVAGSSRDDIERCLNEFGVRDTRAVLERVFGY